MGQNNDDAGNGNDEFWTCCNDDQTLFLLLYIAFTALALLTAGTFIAKPLRLVTTFCHEACHAVMCYLSGGDVMKIQVYSNEGGVTQYRGGCRCLIIPAGYVGASAWAMVLVILSGGRKTSTAAAVIFILALIIALCYSPNMTMIVVNISYALLLAVLVGIEWFYPVVPPMLQYNILFFGVYIGVLAFQDIYLGTVVRTVEGSDAYACSKEVPCCRYCPPKCIGIQWLTLAVILQLFGSWIALVQMSDECTNISWFRCVLLATSIDENPWVWIQPLADHFGENFRFGGFWG